MTRTVTPPLTRNQLAVDIADSTSRRNVDKGRDRQAMYRLLTGALTTAGIRPNQRDGLVDRGDGILVLIHPVDEVPKTLLLDTIIPTLGRLLAEHNAGQPDQHLRLRAAIHSGLVHNDGDGWFAESLDLLFRLLNAPQLKKTLREANTPLVLVVSEDIYKSVVSQGYDGIDASAFTPSVRVKIAGQLHHGWVRVQPMS